MGVAAGAVGGFPLSWAAMAMFSGLVAHVAQYYALIPLWILVAALGFWGVMLVRRRLDVTSGFVLGCSLGLFGMTALCTSLTTTTFQ